MELPLSHDCFRDLVCHEEEEMRLLRHSDCRSSGYRYHHHNLSGNEAGKQLATSYRSSCAITVYQVKTTPILSLTDVFRSGTICC